MRNTLLIVIVGVGIFVALFVWRGQSQPRSAVNTDKDSRIGTTIKLTPRTVAFSDGTEATFRLAADFDIAVAAEGLGKARFMTMSPDGRLFIPDMVNWNLSREGRLLVLDDLDPQTKRFKKQSVYLLNLRGPNSVAFYTDKNGKTWLYLALTEALYRYPYTAGDTKPSGERETIVRFPNKQSPGAVGIVWHVTRTILFRGDTLYVSVGSGCNICEQPEDEMRAVILAMDPDGKNERIVASGFKNAVGMDFAGDTLYATENGVDHLGPDKPDDVMFKIEDGTNYGWPYCYELAGAKHDETAMRWSRKNIDCKDVQMSFVSFGPHTAPLGVTYFKDGPPVIRNTFLVALHGSHDSTLKKGYSVVRVTRDGKQDIFMDGFITDSGKRPARPVHILQLDDDSMLLSDDHGGRIFYIYEKSSQ